MTCSLAQQSIGQSSVNSSSLDLVPLPSYIQMEEGFLSVGPGLWLSNTSDDEEGDKVITTFATDLKEMGFDVGIHEKADNGPNRPVTIYLLLKKGSVEYGQEGYGLHIDKDISIEANTPDGLFWGTRTLLQLLLQDSGHNVPKVKITDVPSYGYRGLMVDVARHFHSMDFHVKTIKKMATYKLNHYMIHFSDNQSYTLPSDLYPNLPTPGRHYTKAEIAWLVGVANDYNITIVPSVDVPGHAGTLAEAIPGLRFDANPNAIDITREETYQTINSLFGEIMTLIPGPLWHLGADEVKYPDSHDAEDPGYSARMHALGVEKGDQLLNYFINRMHAFVKEKGRKMLVWEGFHPKVEPKVDRDIIVCPFDAKHEGRMPMDYVKAGYKLLNTSWTPLYVADKIYMTTPEIMARWTPTMFGAGRSPQPYSYWQKLRPEDITTDIIGAQMCSWNNEEKAEWGLLFGALPGFPTYGRPGPRVQIFSERTWGGSDKEIKDLLERVGAAYW